MASGGVKNYFVEQNMELTKASVAALKAMNGECCPRGHFAGACDTEERKDRQDRKGCVIQNAFAIFAPFAFIAWHARS